MTVPDELDSDLAALAVLTDGVRRAAYRAVLAAGTRPVGRDEVAEVLGVGRTLAAFHLDKLNCWPSPWSAAARTPRSSTWPASTAAALHPAGTCATCWDPDVIVTMSVWDSVESLRAFTYQSAHLDYLRRRRDWFQPHDFPASLVLWWTPAGRIPTVEEACQRLELVAAAPCPEAFTFRRTFPAPELTVRHVVGRAADHAHRLPDHVRGQ